MACIHKRYGDLQVLSDKTDARCHLCHGEVDLAFYGPPGVYGLDTVTVDHLIPQAYGGDDDPDNLMLAHASCNTARGTLECEDVRLALAGTTDAPLGSTEKNVVSVLAGGGAYAAGGTLFAKERPDGTKEFNHGAAALSALVVGLLTRSAL